MVNIIIVESIKNEIFDKNISQYRFLSSRELSSLETYRLKQNHLHRYYLPLLNEKDSKEFFYEFDQFWAELVTPFKRDHLFWRRSVSSKMQEWEFSLGYFLLILFTLAKFSQEKDLNIVFICKREETDALYCWAQKRQWNIVYIQRDLIGRTVSKIKSFFLYGRRVLSLCYNKILSPHVQIKDLNFNGACLMTSFFYARSLTDHEYKDPFWGELDLFLEKNGCKTLFLTDSLQRLTLSIRHKINMIKKKNVFLPYTFMKWKDVFCCCFKAPFIKVKISNARFYDQDFAKLTEAYANKYYCRFNFIAESFYHAIKRLCSYVEFNDLFIIFEGNSIERASMQGFSQKGNGIIKAYAQGVTYPLNLKLRCASGEKGHRIDPDIFISTGPYARELLSYVGNRNLDVIKGGCSLRTIPPQGEPLKKEHLNKVLIAFDGVNSSVSLLDWICENAKMFQGYEVILRGHPNVPLEHVRTKMVEALGKNFEFSSLPLKEDIERCFCVLYRHTSVGLQALLNDTPIIHLAIDSPLSGDPIQELIEGKWVAQTPEEVAECLKYIKNLSDKDKRSFVVAAQKFVFQYFAEPDDINLRSFIE